VIHDVRNVCFIGSDISRVVRVLIDAHSLLDDFGREVGNKWCRNSCVEVMVVDEPQALGELMPEVKSEILSGELPLFSFLPRSVSRRDRWLPFWW